MNILILNPILYTAERNIIPNVDSIKDTMIYNMCIGFVALGHNITLCAAEEFRPQKREDYDFDVHFFRSDWTHFFHHLCFLSLKTCYTILRSFIRILIVSSQVKCLQFIL